MKTVTGRSKDILIRGGENVPVVEVENLIYKHPAIHSAALVGVPDLRLGERGCLYVTVMPGANFSMDEMTHYLEENQMAKQYWPEYLEVLTELPRTLSGKIQKFKLRDMAKKFVVN
jgi:cyclohexanecarboxylate-CoA ligase